MHLDNFNQPAPNSNLLVCDDSPMERMGLVYFLRRAGYNVEEAETGEAALVKIKQGRFDLLLLDLNMPDLNGFDVLTYIQKTNRNIPVILLSGMAPDDIQDKMHSLPTQALPPLLIKPIDPEQLLQVVELQLHGELPEEA
ncbi:MAG TPA: response regulator [Tepidisphaeraceae bacterium]|jgi:DNA-binding response OmpR family regulator